MIEDFRNTPKYKLAQATDSLRLAVEALTDCLRTDDVELVMAAYGKVTTCLTIWIGRKAVELLEEKK